MPATLTRKMNLRPKHRKPAREKPSGRTSAGGGPIYITAASVIGGMLFLNFDQPVALSGTPKFTTDVAGAVPTSAQLATANRVVIFFSSSVAAATTVNLSYRDPAIRNLSGGYVTSNRVPI